MIKSGTTQAKLALVVDDSPIQRRVLSRLLEEEGYRVCSAYDGENAVQMYISQQPELVLMDINMPVMNGFDALQEIREKYSGLIVIAQTAFAMAEEKQKCLNLGCNDYISKPIKKEELFKLVDQHMVSDKTLMHVTHPKPV